MNPQFTKGFEECSKHAAESSESGVQLDEKLLQVGFTKAEHFFPAKLHYMLGEIQKEGMAHIISWQPHGRSFIVRDKKLFVEKILPTWFRQKKFTSFQRQLNLYGFMRFSQGLDKGAYFHPMFLRGCRSLCARIERVKVKGTGPRKPSCPDKEPNFYALPFLPCEEEEKDKKLPPNEATIAQQLRPMAGVQLLSLPGPTHRVPSLSPMTAQQRPLMPSSPVPSSPAVSTRSPPRIGLDQTTKNNTTEEAMLMEAHRIRQASLDLLHAIEVNEVLLQRTKQQLAMASSIIAPPVVLSDGYHRVPYRTTSATSRGLSRMTSTTNPLQPLLTPAQRYQLLLERVCESSNLSAPRTSSTTNSNPEDGSTAVLRSLQGFPLLAEALRRHHPSAIREVNGSFPNNQPC